MSLKTHVLAALAVFFFLHTTTVHAQELDWWQNAVIYQVYPRSFRDSDNSGLGDLPGVIEKLPHFVDAGITAIWFSPIYKSPGVDAGYDISDFRDINEEFGTLADFQQLLTLAHAAGLKVVLDFVPNHSSDQHDWFQRALAGEAQYQNYYIWRDVNPSTPDTPPNDWTSYFDGPTWTKAPDLNKWYFHQFAPEQPDLNYGNPQLVEEMKDVLRFWLDMGVDGFRVDIISALFEDFETGSEDEWIDRSDQPPTYDMVYQWRELLDEYTSRDGVTRVMMTESYSAPEKLFPYYGNGQRLGAHFSFNFWLIQNYNTDQNARDLRFLIQRWFAYMPIEYTANWVLGNHDQFRVASRFNPGLVDGFNMLAMLLPGVAVTYNGEEIGMQNGEVVFEDGQDPQGCNAGEANFNNRGRDFQRTPYHWDDTVNAGFNDGAEPWLPVSGAYTGNNLAAQKSPTGKSHYKNYQALVRLRQTNALKFGELHTIALTANVLAVVRYRNANEFYVLLMNVKGTQQNVDLTYFTYLPELMRVEVSSVTATNNNGATIRKAGPITLSGYEAIVLTLYNPPTN